MAGEVTPTSFEEAADTLREAARAGEPVRIRGGGTKPWGAGQPSGMSIHTTGLDRVLEHNAGDLTASLEAGVPLARAQQQFAAAGQMLALDPWLGLAHEATIGGIVAAADAGPLRHRYGAPRDLILGMTVALSDGTISRSGGKVIKNVAGYDLGKLFCGSLGTLGMILAVNVRLHPLPAQPFTTLGAASEVETLAQAARTLSAAPLELEALDVAWRDGRGGILARCAGVQSEGRAEHAASLMREAGLEQIELSAEDGELWARQRAGQRSAEHALLRVAARPSELAAVLRATEECGGTLVGRAAVGHCFIAVSPGELPRLSERVPAEAWTMLLDHPQGVGASHEPWGRSPAGRTIDLMRQIKARFDPAQICNPGVFVGGI